MQDLDKLGGTAFPHTSVDPEMARRLVQAWNEKHQVVKPNCSCQDLMGSPCCPVHG